jgi:hypothetical protein
VLVSTDVPPPICILVSSSGQVCAMIGRELGVDLNLFRWLVGTPLARILPTFEWIAGL